MMLFLRLAWRNVWRHRRRTLIVVLAIALCTGLLMVYQGFMAGFDQAIYGNAIKVMGGNIQVHAPGYEDDTSEFPMLPLANDQDIIDAAMAHDEVLAATRRINTGGMITSREGAYAVQIVGVEPESEMDASIIGQNVTEGRNLTADDRDNVLLGKGLADSMEVGIGDRVAVAGRDVHNQMRQRTMTVIGIYDLNMPDLEQQTLYMSLAEAQSLYLNDGQATEVVLWLKTLGQEEAVIRQVGPSMSAWEVTSWRVNLPELTETIEIKGKVMDMFSVVMLAIAGIGMLNLLLMAVYERTREIGVLGALGLKPKQISRLFLLEGVMMGVLGSLAGAALGILLNATLGQIGFDFSAFTDMQEMMALITGRIYPTMAWDKVPQYVVMAVIISILASVYPAREAARREPAAALHFV